jgi:hypothetical protein
VKNVEVERIEREIMAAQAVAVEEASTRPPTAAENKDRLKKNGRSKKQCVRLKCLLVNTSVKLIEKMKNGWRFLPPQSRHHLPPKEGTKPVDGEKIKKKKSKERNQSMARRKEKRRTKSQNQLDGEKKEKKKSKEPNQLMARRKRRKSPRSRNQLMAKRKRRRKPRSQNQLMVKKEKKKSKRAENQLMKRRKRRKKVQRAETS